jgi:hypothetical protein
MQFIPLCPGCRFFGCNFGKTIEMADSIGDFLIGPCTEDILSTCVLTIFLSSDLKCVCEIDDIFIAIFWLTLLFVALFCWFHHVDGRDLRQRDGIEQHGSAYTCKGYDITGDGYPAKLPIPVTVEHFKEHLYF